MQTSTQPYALARGEGQPLWFMETLTLVKATGSQTGGAFGLIDQLMPTGYSTPLHVHHREDEAFYVVEGEISFVCGNDRVNARPGTYAFGPRGIPHGYRAVGTSPSRLLLLTSPGGFEQFFVEGSQPAAGLVLPPAGLYALETLIALAGQYEVDVLGPLPE